MKKPPPLADGSVEAGRFWCLLLDLVHPIAGFALGGLDLDSVFFGGSREKAADAVGLPRRGFRISASVAPFGQPISSRMFAPLLSARGVPGPLVPAKFAASALG
jgi:hypothetical protein